MTIDETRAALRGESTPQEPADRATDHADAETQLPSSFDDAGMAEVLADHLRGRWLYVATWGRWLHWDGTRWASDDTEQAAETARQFFVELVAVIAATGASSKDVGRVAGYRNKSKLDAALTMARRIEGIATSPDELDQHPDLLNVNNGTIDLRNGALLDHDPNLRLTRLAPVDYHPDATHADITTLLQVVPADVADWLQILFGYAATGHTSEDIVPVFDGSGGNGKTTLLEAVGSALGDYAEPVAPQLVMRTSHESHPTIKADLHGKRLVWISETEEGGALRMEQLKALTGGDRIKARFIAKNYFTFTPTHTLIVATNHRPLVNSTEYAAWRRLRLIRFPFTYKPTHQASPGDRAEDHSFRGRVKTYRPQRQALLAWIVAGAIAWHKTGLPPCPTIEADTADWRRTEDVILRFITDELDLVPDAITTGSDLFTTYRNWCDHEGRNPGSNKTFTQRFLEHEDVIRAGITSARKAAGVIYKGVTRRVTPDF